MAGFAVPRRAFFDDRNRLICGGMVAGSADGSTRAARETATEVPA